MDTTAKTANVQDVSMADPDNRKCVCDIHAVDFAVGSFVTQGNLAAEITPLIISLYISDKHSDDDGDDCVSSWAVVQTLQTEVKLSSGFIGSCRKS